MMKRKDSGLIECLKQDAWAMSVPFQSFLKRKWAVQTNPRWRFIVLLRKYEFYSTKTNPLLRLYAKWIFYKYKTLGMRLGFSIPPFVCGPGLSLPHYGTIVISKNAHLGRNCRIHVGVNIGASGGKSLAPTLGDNVYIGPGAKLFGDIVIGNNVSIGANAVVNKSFREDNLVLAGIPAGVVKRGADSWWETNGLTLEY